jgi:N-acetyl-alpha-D-muramate 1-phosphate uridylyltransferase
MILAAGRGERLRPLTDRVPKPLLPIAGEPLIAHQLRWLARAGIRDVVINLHHLGDAIAASLGDGAPFGVRIAYSRETTRLETGGGIVKALPLLGTEPFLVLNGDIWTDFPFEHLQLAHGDLAHLVLVEKPTHRSEGDFGLIGDRVTRTQRSHVYCGISILHPSLLDAAPAGPFSLRDLLFDAADAGRVGGETWSGRWIDIGSPDQLDAVRRIAS